MSGFEIVIIVGWVVCGITASGILYGHCEKCFGSLGYSSLRQDYSLSIGAALFGPLALLSALIITGFAEHGWTLRFPRRAAPERGDSK